LRLHGIAEERRVYGVQGYAIGYFSVMSRNQIRVEAAPESVFDVLDDPYAYPE